jgi:hypothetical protein
MNEVDTRDRLELSRALMEKGLDMTQRLEPAAEARLRPADAFRDRADTATVECVQVQNAVGLAEPDRTKHDGFGLVRAAGH